MFPVPLFTAPLLFVELLLFTSLLLVIVRPDLESIIFPEPSTIRVLEPDAPLLLTVEFLEPEDILS